MAAPAWVAAVLSDDDEEDFPRRRIPFSAAAGLGESEVYVVEDDDVQVVNVMKLDQPRPSAFNDTPYYMHLRQPSTGLLNLPQGRHRFNGGRGVHHFAATSETPGHEHDEMPQKKRKRKEVQQERRLRDARSMPESVPSDSWLVHDFVIPSHPRGYGVLQGGPASQLRGRGLLGPMPERRVREEGILGGGPDRWARVEGLLGGVRERRVVDEEIFVGLPERRAREEGILGVRPAFQLREQNVLRNRPALGLTGYETVLTVEAHSSGSIVDQEQFNSLEEPDVKGRGARGRAPAPARCNLARMVKGNTMNDWWRSLQAHTGAEPSRLHWDVLNFCKAHELKPEQIQSRKEGLELVESVVHQIWPNAQVHLFGSTATGLALPWSDIDVAIMSSFQHSSWQKSSSLSMMSILAKKLKKDGQCQSLKQIPFAKVPILKVILKSGLACDICFDVDNGLKGVPVVRQFLQQYEALRPLCLILKFFLGQRDLNEVYTGGLASFALVNMVISHLQKLCLSGGGHDLGALLLSFFTRFGSMHDYGTDVVSTRPNSYASKQTKGWVNFRDPDLLSVEDPLDPNSDIAKGSYKIQDIRSQFLRAQKVLLTHWYEENVLGQLVDMTRIPDRASKPQKKVTKQPARKKRKKNGVLGSGEEDTRPIWIQRRDSGRKKKKKEKTRKRRQEASDSVGKSSKSKNIKKDDETRFLEFCQSIQYKKGFKRKTT